MSGRSRARGITISYLYTILNTVIGLFISAYLIRMMGQTAYGIHQIMTSFATYLSLFQFGTGTIMTRNISLCQKNGEWQYQYKRNVSTIWTIAIIQVAILVFVSFAFYNLIDLIYQDSLTVEQIAYGKSLFLIISAKLVLSFLIQVLNGIILGREHYSFSSALQLAFLLIRTSLVILILLHRPYAICLTIIDSCLEIILFIITFRHCKVSLNVSFSFRFFDRSIFVECLPLSLALFLQTIINMANGNVDKFIIGIVMSPEAVSVYSIGMFIYTTFSSLTTVPISMYMPKIAGDMRDGKSGAELTKTLIQPSRLVFMIGGIVLFGFLAVGRQFLSIVYGNEYIEAWAIAIVIMYPMLINMSNGVIVNVLDVMNKRIVRSLILSLTTLINIFLTVLWIRTWGMIGAAVATGVSTLVGQVFLMNLYYCRCLKLKIIHLFRETFRGILPSLVFATVLSLISIKWISNELIQLLVGGLVFCGTLLVSMAIFGANTFEKRKMRQVINYWTKKE